MSLNEVPDYANEIDKIQDVYDQEMQSLKVLQETRSNYERIYVLERLKNLDKLSAKQKKELEELKKKQAEVTSHQQETELSIHKLRLELINKQITYEKTMQKSVEEIRLTSEAIYWDKFINLANAANKKIEERETTLATNKYLRDVSHMVALDKLKTSKNKNDVEAAQKIANIEAKVAAKYAAKKQELIAQEDELIAKKEAGAISEVEYTKKIQAIREKLVKLADEERKTVLDKIKKESDKEGSGRALKKFIKEQEKAEKEAKKRKDALDAKDEQKVKKRAIAEQAYKDKLEAKSEQKKNFNSHVQGIQDELFGAGKSPEERLHALKNLGADPDTGEFSGKALVNNMAAILSNFAQKLDSKIENIGSVKSIVDTALQGSNMGTGGLFKIGSSYWDRINSNYTKYAGITPYLKRSDLQSNLVSMVQEGIAFNVDERAFLSTIKDKIAATFEASNGTLLRLVRIQQQDTTAARLGMESSLTAFLNSMYETSEYMKSTAAAVKGSLEEAMSLMEAKTAVGLEHTVQKWMGSMYSVGMSDNAVQSIAKALGEVAAGQINSLTGEGAGNLVVMAANQAGISIADLLNRGMTDEDANNLLASAVEYLADLYNDNKDSKVVQQQIAQVFGVAASDLKAAVNLAKDNKTIDAIFKTVTTYDSNLERLYDMAGSIGKRMSQGEVLTNMWENFQYTMASGISNNPMMYALYKIGNLMDQTGVDFNIPFLNVMGFGVDLNATVSQLMRGGAMAGSLLSGIGQMIGGGGGLNMKAAIKGLGSDNKTVDEILSAGYNGTGDLLKALEKTGLKVNREAIRSDGNKIMIDSSGLTAALNLAGLNNTVNGGSGSEAGSKTSESGTSTNVGNSSSEDIKNTTLSDAKSDTDAQMAEAKESEDNSVNIETVNENVVKIYTLLSDVVDGASSLSIRMSMDSLSPYSNI